MEEVVNKQRRTRSAIKMYGASDAIFFSLSFISSSVGGGGPGGVSALLAK
jgi:hypothetical protein